MPIGLSKSHKALVLSIIELFRGILNDYKSRTFIHLNTKSAIIWRRLLHINFSCKVVRSIFFAEIAFIIFAFTYFHSAIISRSFFQVDKGEVIDAILTFLRNEVQRFAFLALKCKTMQYHYELTEIPVQRGIRDWY